MYIIYIYIYIYKTVCVNHHKPSCSPAPPSASSSLPRDNWDLSSDQTVEELRIYPNQNKMLNAADCRLETAHGAMKHGFRCTATPCLKEKNRTMMFSFIMIVVPVLSSVLLHPHLPVSAKLRNQVVHWEKEDPLWSPLSKLEQPDHWECHSPHCLGQESKEVRKELLLLVLGHAREDLVLLCWATGPHHERRKRRAWRRYQS